MKTSAVLADICPIIGILANVPENYWILRVQFRPHVHLILHQLLGSCSVFSDGKVEREISKRAVAAVCSRALRSEEGRTLGGNSLLIVLMVMSTLYGEGDRATWQLFLFSVEVACAYSTVHPLSTTLYGTVSDQPLLLLYHVLYIIDACAEILRGLYGAASLVTKP